MTCPMSDPSDFHSEQGSNTDTHPYAQTGDPRKGGTAKNILNSIQTTILVVHRKRTQEAHNRVQDERLACDTTKARSPLPSVSRRNHLTPVPVTSSHELKRSYSELHQWEVGTQLFKVSFMFSFVVLMPINRKHFSLRLSWDMPHSLHQISY